MRSSLLSLVLICIACGSGTTSAPPAPSGSPDGGTVTYTKIPNPNDVLNLSGIGYSRDGSMKVATISGVPSISLGSVPGQSWFVFAGTCPADVTAVYPRYQMAVQDRTAVPVATAPTNYALGLYVGAQLPIQTCFEFVNCDMSGQVCSFQPFALEFR